MSGSISSLRRSASSRASSVAAVARRAARPPRCARSAGRPPRRARARCAPRGAAARCARRAARGSSAASRARPGWRRRSSGRPRARARPRRTSMRTSSPTNSGLPSLVASTLAATARRQVGGADHVGGEPHRRARVEAAERDDVGDESARRHERGAQIAQLGPRADQHEQAARRCPTARGARRDRAAAARPSAGRRSPARPACSAASAARKRRTTKKVSSGDAGVPLEQRGDPAAMRSRSGSLAISAASAAVAGVVFDAAGNARTARGDRREGRAARGIALRGDHGRRIPEPVCDLVDQARLPEARRPEHDGEARGGRRDAASYTAVIRASSSSRPTKARSSHRPGARATPRGRPSPCRRGPSARTRRRARASPRAATRRRVAAPINDLAVARLLLQARRDVERVADAGGVLVARPPPRRCSPPRAGRSGRSTALLRLHEARGTPAASRPRRAPRAARRPRRRAAMPNAAITPSPSSCTTVPPALRPAPRTAW